jgi:hypothetical protein
MNTKLYIINLSKFKVIILSIVLCLILLVPSVLFVSLYFYFSGPANPPVTLYLLLLCIPLLISTIFAFGIVKEKRVCFFLAFLGVLLFILVFIYGYFQFTKIPIP